MNRSHILIFVLVVVSVGIITCSLPQSTLMQKFLCLTVSSAYEMFRMLYIYRKGCCFIVLFLRQHDAVSEKCSTWLHIASEFPM